MVDKHLQNFFGNNTTMLVRSTSKGDPFIFLEFIKKNGTGYWEKPANGEGLQLRCNLEEIIMLKDVMKRKFKTWNTNLKFTGRDINIALKWEENSHLKLWITVGKYSKVLNYSQVQLLKALLKHLLKEKVKYSTITSSLDETDSQISQISQTREIEKKPKESSYKKKNPGNNKSVETSSKRMLNK